jgi:hypothetical protein
MVILIIYPLISFSPYNLEKASILVSVQLTKDSLHKNTLAPSGISHLVHFSPLVLEKTEMEKKSSCGILSGSPNRSVLVKCETSGKMVPTGIEMDAEAFKSVTLEGYSFLCRECRKVHTWCKKDATLA